MKITIHENHLYFVYEGKKGDRRVLKQLKAAFKEFNHGSLSVFNKLTEISIPVSIEKRGV